jgi:hypothetical protein
MNIFDLQNELNIAKNDSMIKEEQKLDENPSRQQTII